MAHILPPPPKHLLPSPSATTNWSSCEASETERVHWAQTGFIGPGWSVAVLHTCPIENHGQNMDKLRVVANNLSPRGRNKPWTGQCPKQENQTWVEAPREAHQGHWGSLGPWHSQPSARTGLSQAGRSLVWSTVRINSPGESSLEQWKRGFGRRVVVETHSSWSWIMSFSLPHS